MDFKRHPEFETKHAVLSASKPSWLNYSDDKLADFVENLQAAAWGSKLHDYAKMAINLGVKQQNTSQTLNMYINDAISYRMRPEVMLFYSKWAFGTADAIQFRDNTLRIFDLKTGFHKTDSRQLAIYAAYFCLEYKYLAKPFEIEYDLRIYQNDEIFPILVEPEEIAHIMSDITEKSALITAKMEEV